MESDASEGRQPGMAGDRQGARPAWVRGPETNTKGSSNPMNCAEMTCVHAGRRVEKNTEETGNHRTGHADGKEGGARDAQKKTNHKKKSMHRQRTHSTERTGSGRRNRSNRRKRQEMELPASATGLQAAGWRIHVGCRRPGGV